MFHPPVSSYIPRDLFLGRRVTIYKTAEKRERYIKIKKKEKKKRHKERKTNLVGLVLDTRPAGGYGPHRLTANLRGLLLADVVFTCIKGKALIDPLKTRLRVNSKN